MNDLEIRYKSGKRKGEIIDKYAMIIKELHRCAEGSKSFKLHLKKWTGSRRNMTLIDNEYNYEKVLDIYSIKYTKGNDAPKGGVTGDYIEVIVDKRNHFWR